VRDALRDVEVAAMEVVKVHGDGTDTTKGLGLALARLKKAREDLKVCESTREQRRESERLRRVNGREA
jgi:hypothetical protein